MTTLAIAFAASAMTHQEKVQLSQINVSNVNLSNVSNVINACIDVTNGWKISKIDEAKILPLKDILNLMDNANHLLDVYVRMALKSNNAELISTAYLKLKQHVLSFPDTINNAALAHTLYKFREFTQNEAEAVANQLVQSNKPLSAIRVIYHPDQTNSSLKESNFDDLFNKWLNIPVVINKKYGVQDHLNGILIVSYAIKSHYSKLMQALPKAKILAKNGGICYCDMLRNGQYFDEVRSEFIAGSASLSRKIALANRIDDFTHKSTLTAMLYPQLVSSNDKTKAAVRMNDADKLIDIFKVADDTIAASAIEQAIVILNGVNAGYRTDDLKLALMNINKKYTLKLYNDRDTWEPILSKIRAMIETL